MSDRNHEEQMRNEGEEKTQSGTGGIQRGSQGKGSEAEQVKAELRKKIRSIREGHATGGYCETEKLQAEEKKLDAILRKELDEAKAEFGYSPDPKFKHTKVREIELELNGLSWRPRLVVAND